MRKQNEIYSTIPFVSLLSTCPVMFYESQSQVVLVEKNPPDNAGDKKDAGLIAGSGRSPGEVNGNPLQCFCLENPMDIGALVGFSAWGHKEGDKTEVN